MQRKLHVIMDTHMFTYTDNIAWSHDHLMQPQHLCTLGGSGPVLPVYPHNACIHNCKLVSDSHVQRLETASLALPAND